MRKLSEPVDYPSKWNWFFVEPGMVCRACGLDFIVCPPPNGERYEELWGGGAEKIPILPIDFPDILRDFARGFVRTGYFTTTCNPIEIVHPKLAEKEVKEKESVPQKSQVSKISLSVEEINIKGLKIQIEI